MMKTTRVNLENLRFRKEMGKEWWCNRVGDEWNGFSNHIVSAETKETIKRRLDRFMEEDDRWN